MTDGYDVIKDHGCAAMDFAEDYCRHYCIGDREAVWYGSKDFLPVK